MKTPLLGDRKFYKNVATIGVPVALQSLLVTSGSMVDTMMIGSQGELAVAAVGICAQFGSLLMSAYFGFCNGGTLFFAQFWGARDERGICKAYGLTVSCMMFFGVLFGAAAVLAPEWILRIYTDKVAIQQEGLSYMRVIGFAYPLQVMAFAMSALLRSTEQVKAPLFASIASLLTNVFLNWVLIYGHLGAPALGVTGAAVATVIGNAVNVVFLYVFCFTHKGSFILRIRDQFRWDLAFVKQYFKKSVFIVFNEGTMGVAQMLINIVVGRQAEAGIAALAVFRVIEGIVFAFFKGLTSASAVMIGKQIGAGEHLGGYRDAKRFVLLCPAMTLAVCLLLIPFREPLLGIFGLGPEAMAYGKDMLLFYVLAATVRTCNWIANDTFRAGGESVYGTMVETIFVYCLTIPAMALAGIVFKWPFIAVFALMYLDDFARIGIIVRNVWSGRWIKPVTEEGRRTLPAFHDMMRGHGHKFREKAYAYLSDKSA